MSKLLRATFVLVIVLSPVWAAGSHATKQPSREPFFDARTHQTEYAGPGREKPTPKNIKEVLIAYFGPSTLSHPEGGDMWCAASLAVEEANRAGRYRGLGSRGASAAGGYRGLPFRLVAGWSGNPWGSGVTQVTRMVYVDKVWAVIGGIDGPSTHLAEQVVAKARLTLLSPASTDKTVNLANVPWVFSCLPQDHLQVPVLAQAVASHVERKPFLLVSAVDHDSHLFAVELVKVLALHKLVPAFHFEFDPGKKDFTELVEEVVRTKAHTLVLIAGPQQSAHLIRAVRKEGLGGTIFGGPSMGQRRFLQEAGDTAEPVVFPLLYTTHKGSESFEEKFTSRFGKRPDYLAAHTYDAVNLLVAAIRKAGLNRARICDVVRRNCPWHGVTGSINWDSLGSNSRSIHLGTIRNGSVQSLLEPRSAAAHSPRALRTAFDKR